MPFGYGLVLLCNDPEFGGFFMIKRKLTVIPLFLAVAGSVLTGCGAADIQSPAAETYVESKVNNTETQTGDASAETGSFLSDTSDQDSISIVCTIYPEYDWVNQILGDHAANAEVTYLLDNGADLHNYQPTADDIIKISACDLFIYVGGESDGWAEDALDSAANKDMRVINMMEIMGDSAKAEELKEGMQGHDHEHEDEDHDHEDHDHEDHDHEDHDHEDHDHEDHDHEDHDHEDHDHEDHDHEDHDHEDHDHEDHDHEHHHEEGEVEYDEHVWLSLKNANVLCTEIEKNIEAIDPANAADYKANLDAYTAKLDDLDSRFRSLFDSSTIKTLIFGDRFPFRYFVDDYGLDYYAAFIGCSAETEASFETIVFLSDKANELDSKTIFTIEGSDRTIAQTIINTSGRVMNIAELNSIQSVSDDDIKNGVTYLSLMENNYNVLSEALQ